MRRAWILFLAATALGIIFGAVKMRQARLARTSDVRSSVQTFRAVDARSAAPRASEVFSDPATAQLVDAAISGNRDAVKAAKQRGASMNMRGKEGLRPLHLALLHVSFGSFTALLENGADPNIVADNGVAVMSLVPALAGSKWLEAALRAGGDVEKRDDRRQTPLMLAASRGRVENVQILLANGANVYACDEHQSGPLDHTFHAIKPNVAIAEL